MKKYERYEKRTRRYAAHFRLVLARLQVGKCPNNGMQATIENRQILRN